MIAAIGALSYLGVVGYLFWQARPSRRPAAPTHAATAAISY